MADSETYKQGGKGSDCGGMGGAPPPSPPTSEQIGGVVSAEERRQLVALQELIRRKLEGS